MVHKTNIVIYTLFHLLIVNKIQCLLLTLYNYFYKNLKTHLKFTKFVKIMGAKGAKICLNVKTQWIDM